MLLPWKLLQVWRKDTAAHSPLLPQKDPGSTHSHPTLSELSISHNAICFCLRKVSSSCSQSFLEELRERRMHSTKQETKKPLAGSSETRRRSPLRSRSRGTGGQGILWSLVC